MGYGVRIAQRVASWPLEAKTSCTPNIILLRHLYKDMFIIVYKYMLGKFVPTPVVRTSDNALCDEQKHCLLYHICKASLM